MWRQQVLVFPKEAIVGSVPRATCAFHVSHIVASRCGNVLDGAQQNPTLAVVAVGDGDEWLRLSLRQNKPRRRASPRNP